MRKYVIASVAFVMLIIFALISYGVYLKQKEDAQIMTDRSLLLKGEKARRRNINPVIPIDAISFYSNETTDIVSLVDGKVEKISVKENENVRQGQLLCTVTDEKLPLQLREAESNIFRAEAEFEHAKNSYERYEKLMKLEATSKNAYDEKFSAYRAAAAALESCRARKALILKMQDNQNVCATIDGTILKIYKQNGAYVVSGTPIILLGDYSKLYFNLTMDDKITRFLKVDMEVSLSFRNGTDFDFSKIVTVKKNKHEKFIAVIKNFSPPLKDNPDRRQVFFEIKNQTGILEPKIYRDVTMKLVHPLNSLTVPLKAFTDDNHDTLFVLRNDGTVERRAVKCGLDDGNNIVVREGLKEGEVIITSGVNDLEDGTKVSVNVKK
ncbi:MAG: efflux RND transporter periplasmic adaptor subunit [Selenomonadaceae bacterium]|nr:efflux RND transporter periplasmic adaptor subunit [Selenomonadaceae bacterium]